MSLIRDTCLVPKLSKRQCGNRISLPYFFKIMSFYLYGEVPSTFLRLLTNSNNDIELWDLGNPGRQPDFIVKETSDKIPY